MKIRKNKFAKKRRLKHEVKVIGIVLAVLLLLFAIRFLDLKTTGFAVWTTSNTTNWTVGIWNNTLVNQSTGALGLHYNNGTYDDFWATYRNNILMWLRFDNQTNLGENDTKVYDQVHGMTSNITIGNLTDESSKVNFTISSKLGVTAITSDGKLDKQFVYVDSNATNALRYANSTNYTIMFWVYVKGADPNDAPNIWSNRYNRDIWLRLVGDGVSSYQLQAYVNPADTGLASLYRADSTTHIKRSKWYHIAFSYGNGDNSSAKIYQDGVEITTASWDTGSVYSPNVSSTGWTGSFMFAEFPNLQSRTANMTIDDFIILNTSWNANTIVPEYYALTKDKYPTTGTYESEILVNDNSSNWDNITFGGQYDYQQDFDIYGSKYGTDNGLVFLARFNNNTNDGDNMTGACDVFNICGTMKGGRASGTNPAKIENVTWTNDTRVIQGFVGNSTNFFDFGAGNNLALSDNITIAAWVLLKESVLGGSIMTRGEPGNNYNYMMLYDITSGQPTKLCFYSKINGVLQLPCTTSIEPNIWQHLATTFDGANIKLYVNGVLKSTTAVNLNSQKVTYLENLHSTVHL